MKKLISALLLSSVLTACVDNEPQAIKEYVHVGENWAALNSVQDSENSFNVTVNTVSSAVLGEKLAFKISSEQAGKLWVLQVDPNDDISLIYPNVMSSDNRIEKNSWKTVPKAGAGWSIEAMKPLGNSMMVFIVTDPYTDLKAVFNEPSGAMNKALTLVKKSASWGLAKQVITIKEKL